MKQKYRVILYPNRLKAYIGLSAITRYGSTSKIPNTPATMIFPKEVKGANVLIWGVIKVN